MTQTRLYPVRNMGTGAFVFLLNMRLFFFREAWEGGGRCREADTVTMGTLILVKALLRRREREKRSPGEVISWGKLYQNPLLSRKRNKTPQAQITWKQNGLRETARKYSHRACSAWHSVGMTVPCRMCESPAAGTPFHWSGRRDGAWKRKLH